MPAPILIGIAAAAIEGLVPLAFGLLGYKAANCLLKNKKKGVFNIGLWGRKESGKTTLLKCLGANLPSGQTRRAIQFDNIVLSYENSVRTISINVDEKNDQKSQDVPGDKSFKFLLKMQQKECLDLFIYIFDINNYFNHDKDESDNGSNAIRQDLQMLHENLKSKEDPSNILLLGTHIDEMKMTEAEAQKAFRKSLDGKKYKHIAKNLRIVNLNDGENSKNKILGILNSNNVFGEGKK